MTYKRLDLSDLKEELKSNAEWNKDVMAVADQIEVYHTRDIENVIARVVMIKDAIRDLIEIEEKTNDKSLDKRISLLSKALVSISLQASVSLEALVSYAPKKHIDELKERFTQILKDGCPLVYKYTEA